MQHNTHNYEHKKILIFFIKVPRWHLMHHIIIYSHTSHRATKRGSPLRTTPVSCIQMSNCLVRFSTDIHMSSSNLPVATFGYFSFLSCLRHLFSPCFFFYFGITVAWGISHFQVSQEEKANMEIKTSLQRVVWETHSFMSLQDYLGQKTLFWFIRKGTVF